MTTATREHTIRLRRPWEPEQASFVDSDAPRIIIRAGRRGGKTTGIAIRAVKRFLQGKRILYAAPTQDQVDAFWWEVKRALAEPLDAGVFYKNETNHVIELPDTKQRIRAKTAWNADSLRGDYADELILDEWQLMDEEAWELVGAPMLLDNNGSAVFIYTPPSLHSRSTSKARDPRHAADMYKKAQKDESGRWETYHFSSRSNPHISSTAIAELASDMTQLAIRQEIEAEDVDEVPGALWTRELLDTHRVSLEPESLDRVVVGVDPAGGGGDAIGIVVAARCGDSYYILEDASLYGSPQEWGEKVSEVYQAYEADRVVAEMNYGGEMVKATLLNVNRNLSFKPVSATRGKAVRAEPIAALYEQGKVHHVGVFPRLEDEMTYWVPGDAKSPDRMDALVWAMTELSTRGSYSLTPLDEVEEETEARVYQFGG